MKLLGCRCSSILRLTHQLPSLPSEKGDDDAFGCDHGYEMDELGTDTAGPRGRSPSEAPPSQPANPADILGPAAVEQFAQCVIEQRDAMRQSLGDEAWPSGIALSSSMPEECGYPLGR